jgi:transposase InsO family protein
MIRKHIFNFSTVLEIWNDAICKSNDNLTSGFSILFLDHVSEERADTYYQNFMNHEQAQLSIFEWIESWYNRRRRHSAIGCQTIKEPERSGVQRSQFEENNN